LDAREKMTEFKKMMLGQPFDCNDESIDSVRCCTAKLLMKLNQTLDEQQHTGILQNMMREFDSSSVIRSPLYCNLGKTIRIGKKTFINANATFLDNAHITIGNNVMIGPNANFYTPGHSLDYRQRRKWEVFCEPIVIEDDVWIGGNVVINQGVTIGARSVIAAGSVVTKDVPTDSLYGGTPATLIRQLTENES